MHARLQAVLSTLRYHVRISGKTLVHVRVITITYTQYNIYNTWNLDIYHTVKYFDGKKLSGKQGLTEKPWWIEVHMQFDALSNTEQWLHAQ